jgi:integrase
MSLDLSKVKSAINRKYLDNYLRQCEVVGRSERRKQDIYLRLRKISNDYINGKDFKKLTRRDFENISIALQKNLNSFHSIKSYVATIKVFARFLEKKVSSQSLPDKYLGLQTPRDTSKYKMFRGVDEIITPKEAFEYSKNATTKRNAFAFMILIDCGLRPHELLKAKRKDIIVDESNYWYIKVPHGTKTGFRKVRIVFAIPFVDDYLKVLPSNSETKLIDITENRLIKIVKKMSEGRVTPYLLRHSSISFYASYLNEAMLCERYGWVVGSKQTQCYVHLTQKQINERLNKTLKQVNGNGERDDLEKIEPQFCLNCNSYSNHNEKYCRVCRKPLDLDEVNKRERMDEIAYKSAERLLIIEPEEFKKIAKGFGVELVAKD